MKSADSSETLCRNCVTVLDSLPTNVTTTGIPTEMEFSFRFSNRKSFLLGVPGEDQLAGLVKGSPAEKI